MVYRPRYALNNKVSTTNRLACITRAVGRSC